MRTTWRSAIGVAALFLAFGVSPESRAAEVNGIYTEPATKDVGELTKIKLLKGVKVRGWIDAYFVGNFNDPDRAVVNRHQLGVPSDPTDPTLTDPKSAVVSRDLTIEGRTFDVHDRSFSLSLAELEVEKVPEMGGVGFKFDMAFGDTQDIIVDTIQGAIGNDAVSEFDKTFQHASIGYVAPIGRGLRIDFGKFVTHIGGETIASIKNNNYSHAFFYTYAIPFQDSGFRFNYPWADTFYTELYVLNGWNATSDNNTMKSFGPSFGWTITPEVAWYANYLVGPEQTDNNDDYRHLFDTQLFLTLTPEFNTLVNFDYGTDEVAGSDVSWWGVTGTFRYKMTDNFEPAVRVEYYDDEDGFSTGLAQSLFGFTITLNYKIGLTEYAHVLIRPEYRFDSSDEDFFTEDDRFRDTDSQHTAGFGVVFYM